MSRTGRAILIASAGVLLAALPAAGQSDAPYDPIDPVEVESDPNANSLPSLEQMLALVDRTNDANDPNSVQWSSPVKLAVVFAGLAILPSLLVMVTSFTRIIIVLSFVRRALATQTIPPNMAVVGLSLFLTVFTMAPTLKAVNRKALQPYLQDQISFTRAGEVGTDQLKQFMLRQTRKKDMQVFLGLAEIQPRTVRDIPMHVIIPSFAISEFRTAFEMGCLLFIPFLLIDMVVAGILLSAGMMMLPPMMVSLPFKIILFVLVDGWKLVVLGVVRSFN
jgi:flagellar biosynthetic protein FliP